jgi:homoserine kinase
MTEPFEFQVPATCAHLGPGFGVLGIAIDIALSIAVEEHKGVGFAVERHGPIPTSHAPKDPRHDPILRALHAVQERYKIKLPAGLRISATNAIPAFSGLGTNSASFAAGFGIAAHYAKETPPADELIDLLVELGGTAAHGGAALYGGLVACCPVQTAQETVSHRVFRYACSDDWKFVVAAPAFHIGTAEVVRALPASLPHGVIKRTTGRLLGLLHALAVGDDELLRNCLVDEVHVPFRRTLAPGVDFALGAIEESGIAGATISGAGPALVVLTTKDEVAVQAEAILRTAFESAGVSVDVRTVGGWSSGALE